MRSARDRWHIGLVLLLLVICQFAVRPLPGDPRLVRVAPDFLLLAFLIYAIRARPGEAAVVGFLVGLVTDAMTGTAFGGGALAHTVIGYFAAWGKAVFFAENLFVNAAFFLFGTWLRDVLVLLVGRHMQGPAFWWQIGYVSPVKALTTAVVGVLVLLVFRRWLNIRINE